MIVVSENGSKIMKFSDEFDKYAKEVLHIANPFPMYWKRIADYTSKDSDGTLRMNIEESIKHDIETRVEREEWIRLRDRYVAERILRELGYEVLQSSHYRENFPDAIPCEGASGQCSMDCPKFGKCGL